jgi:hypothetical protein
MAPAYRSQAWNPEHSVKIQYALPFALYDLKGGKDVWDRNAGVDCHPGHRFDHFRCWETSSDRRRYWERDPKF